MKIVKKNSKTLEPMMTVGEMVLSLKKQNIKFEKISVKAAKQYLTDNNYYNLLAYKNNFLKYPKPAGKYEGMYQDLDFAYLKDLSNIDFHLRLLLFKMIINIEQYLKIKILNTIEKIKCEDGYKIVNRYFERDFNDGKHPKRIHNSIFNKVGCEYYDKIFSKHNIHKNKKIKNVPIWEFLEIITFGELVNFYDFYTQKYNLKAENKDIYILRDIVKLRNAVAHNASVLCELNKKDNSHSPAYKVIQFLKSCNIKKEARDNKLSNARIRQITYTLYMFNTVVTNNEIKTNINWEINDLFYNRIIEHKEYYNNNDLLKSVYSYFDKIIKKHYR